MYDHYPLIRGVAGGGGGGAGGEYGGMCPHKFPVPPGAPCTKHMLNVKQIDKEKPVPSPLQKTTPTTPTKKHSYTTAFNY